MTKTCIPQVTTACILVSFDFILKSRVEATIENGNAKVLVSKNSTYASTK